MRNSTWTCVWVPVLNFILCPEACWKQGWTSCLVKPFPSPQLKNILIADLTCHQKYCIKLLHRTIVLFWPCSLVHLLMLIVCFSSSHTLCNPRLELGRKPTLLQLSVSAFCQVNPSFVSQPPAYSASAPIRSQMLTWHLQGTSRCISLLTSKLLTDLHCLFLQVYFFIFKMVKLHPCMVHVSLLFLHLYPVTHQQKDSPKWAWFCSRFLPLVLKGSVSLVLAHGSSIGFQ